VIVPRRGTEKGVVWRRSGTGNERKTVEKVEVCKPSAQKRAGREA
jgi:hypothetical protein